MNKQKWKLTICAILISTSSLVAQKYKSGSAEIDAVRIEVQNEKSTETTYKERTKILYMWMSALQQQGANTVSFFDLDQQYRKW